MNDNYNENDWDKLKSKELQELSDMLQSESERILANMRQKSDFIKQSLDCLEQIMQGHKGLLPREDEPKVFRDYKPFDLDDDDMIFGLPNANCALDWAKDYPMPIVAWYPTRIDAINAATLIGAEPNPIPMRFQPAIQSAKQNGIKTVALIDGGLKLLKTWSL